MARKGILGGLVGGGSSSKPPVEKHESTDVKDKFFGGKRVKKTTVLKQGRKTQVREDITDIDPAGRTSHRRTVEGDTIK